MPLLLDALENTGCAMDILEALSVNVHFREDVLEKKPLLLETLLRNSTESDYGFVKCSATCVNLLSSPPPVAIPAIVSSFLSKLLHNCHHKPDEENIRPIYTILAGSSSHLLDALPNDIVVRMQDQFKKMLQHDKMKIEGNSSNLFCLAVLALISLVPSSLPAQEQEKPPAERSTRDCRVARLFFESKRAPKTVDLVILQAIYCCSKNCKLSKQDIIESLQLSNVILKAVDDADRAIWLAKNEAKFGKLVEKISSHDRPSEVYCLALQVFVTLSGDCALTETLLPICRLGLCIPTVSKLPRTLRNSIILLLDEPSVQNHLLSLLQAGNPRSPNGVAIRDTEAALVLAETFSDCIVKSASLRQKILHLLSTSTLADHLNRFLQIDNLWNKAYDNHEDICPSAYAEKQTLLWQKICSMFLKTAIFSQYDSLSLDSSMASALLDKTASLGRVKMVCQSFKSRRPALLPILEAESTPCSMAGSELWRGRLKSELAQNADHQYQLIVRTMGDACRDLERRCHEVESPLREEQAKSARLQNDLDSSKARVAELVSRHHEQSLILEGIDEDIKDLKSERDELLAETNFLQIRLDAAIKQAGDSERNRIRELEFSHAATSAEKDELLEAHKHTERVLKVQIQGLEADAVELQAKASLVEEEVVHLEAVIKEQRLAISSASRLACEKQETCNRKQEEFDMLEADKHALQKQIKELSDNCRSLEADLEDKVNSLSRELDNVRSQHQAELAVQSDKLRQSRNEEIQGLQRLVDKQAEDATGAVQEKDLIIRRMESELAVSRAEVEERENALEGIQALHKQTMAFWSKPRRRNTAAEEPIQQGSPISGTPTTPAMPQHKRTSVRFPQEASQHKRSRTKKDLSPSSLDSKHRLRSSASASASAREPARCNKTATMRPPLAGIELKQIKSPTRRGSQQGPPKPAWDEKHAVGNNENVEAGTGQGSLCDSDFFASADQQLIADIHDDASHMGFNDETTEL
ncbi:MAG: hypothetical protein Q9182_000733 [Xanthomendoza sp. 2 TL-2023]